MRRWMICARLFFGLSTLALLTEPSRAESGFYSTVFGADESAVARESAGEPASTTATDDFHGLTYALYEMLAPAPFASAIRTEVDAFGHVSPVVAIAPRPVQPSDFGQGGGLSPLRPDVDAAVAPSAVSPPVDADDGPAQPGPRREPTDYPAPLLETPAVNVASGAESRVLAVNETAEMLRQSNSLNTVEVQRRSPIDFNPHVRGYQADQVYTQADGALWRPARLDLDTAFSKIDTALVEDIIVIPGPYGLRYGPGHAFIDVLTSTTPRYEEGAESHARLGLTTRTNGGQVYGRNTLFGGGANWGYIIYYGHRKGSDYEAGSGRRIPSSYDAQNVLGQFGLDPNEHSQIEFRYNRMRQTDTEYAGQFFDIDFLDVDGYSLSFVDENPLRAWDRLIVEGWYNRTNFFGDTENPSKRTFNVINRVEDALGIFGDPNSSFSGVTNGAITSTGGRGVLTFGETGERQLSMGADYRYLKQGINEFFRIVDGVVADPPDITEVETNMPRSRSFDPGLFVEWTLPWRESWTTAIGGRADWLHTSALASDVRANTSLPNGTANLSQNDVLYAFYVTNNVVFSDAITAQFGFGHGQRTPSLLQRYADGVFLELIQSGFSRVIGDPALRKERSWQIDSSLSVESDSGLFRISGFHAWILDFVTFTGNEITDPGGARLLRFTNTDLATLTGCEANMQRDIGKRWSTFGLFRFVDGRDRVIDMPLNQISPLEGRAGLRLYDQTGGDVWGLEFGARIVDNQDRLGGIRIGTTSVVDVITLEKPTPGFTTYHLRGYFNVTDNLSIVSGIDNLTDKNYLEHLSVRLPDDPPFVGTEVLEPGITPYVNIEWIY